ELSAEDSKAESVIMANVPLVLEGLEFHRLESRTAREPYQWKSVLGVRKSLHAANCRFLTRVIDVQIHGTHAGLAEIRIRNCEFVGTNLSPVYAIQLGPGRSLVMDNCLSVAHVSGETGLADTRGAIFRLTRNTFRTPSMACRFSAIGADRLTVDKQPRVDK